MDGRCTTAMSMLYLLRWVWARNGGAPARRAVIRWGVRLFRREWRQQFLVFGLLTVAVAAMVTGSAVATAAPGQPGEATFGTATAMITLPGSDPRLAADVAAIRQRYRTVDVIENENLSTGTTQDVQLRAEDPRAAFGSPMLALVSGRYPAAPGQVALTGAVADLYGVRRGGVVRLAGRSYRVSGIVQNPGNLLDEFALVEPGQVTVPAQVSILLDAQRGGIRGPAVRGRGVLPGHRWFGPQPRGDRARGVRAGPGVHRPGRGRRVHGAGAAAAARPGHAQLARRHRPQHPARHDRQRRRRRRGGRGRRIGRRLRRLAGVCSAPAGGHWPRDRPAGAALGSDHHRDGARGYHRDAGGTPASAHGRAGSGGRRAIWPPAAGEGRAPVRAGGPDHARRRAGPAAVVRRHRHWRPWLPADRPDRHVGRDVPAGGYLRDCPGRGGGAAVAGGGAHRAA